MHPQADSLPAGASALPQVGLGVSAWLGLLQARPQSSTRLFQAPLQGAPPGWRQRQRQTLAQQLGVGPPVEQHLGQAQQRPVRMAPFDQLQDIASRHHAFLQHPVVPAGAPGLCTLRDIPVTSKRSLSFQQGMRPWDTSSSAVPARTRSPRQTSASLQPLVLKFSPKAPACISRGCSPSSAIQAA